jgi:3-hydroxybutyryl-CoA dehydrogenase
LRARDRRESEYIMEIKKVGVVGCGIMGTGIAQVSAQSGYQVIVKDEDDKILQKGLRFINNMLSRSVEKGRISSEEKEAIQDRLQGTKSWQDFSDCDYVIEAVPEDMEIKKQVFAQLDDICPEHVILATNTSVLSVIDIASATGRA